MKSVVVQNKKPLIAVIITFIVIIGGTFAYFSTSDYFPNNFHTGSYAFDTKETFTSPTNWAPGDTTPKVVTVKNTGDICENVRIWYEDGWEDASGNPIPNKYGSENAAIINLANRSDWVKNGKYYYYKNNLQPNGETTAFMNSVTYNDQVEDYIECTDAGNGKRVCAASEGYGGGEYTLTLHIETVQCGSAEQTWGVNPSQVKTKAVLSGHWDFQNCIGDLAGSINNVTAFLKGNSLPSGFVPAGIDSGLSCNLLSNRYDTYQMFENYPLLDKVNPFSTLSDCNNWDFSSEIGDLEGTFTCEVDSTTGDYYPVFTGRKQEVTTYENCLEYYEGNGKMYCERDELETIAAWYDSNDGTIYYYTDADELYLPEDSGVIFSNMRYLTNISGLQYFDSSNVTSMNGMFGNCTSLTSIAPIASWDVSNVYSMDSLFFNCSSITDASSISGWDVSNVDDNYNGFYEMAYNVPNPPIFTIRPGTWNSSGTYIPN